MDKALREAKAKLREAVVKLRQAKVAKLWLEDELAYKRLVISRGVCRSRVRRLEQQRAAEPQRSLFSSVW